MKFGLEIKLHNPALDKTITMPLYQGTDVVVVEARNLAVAIEECLPQLHRMANNFANQHIQLVSLEVKEIPHERSDREPDPPAGGRPAEEVKPATD